MVGKNNNIRGNSKMQHCNMDWLAMWSHQSKIAGQLETMMKPLIGKWISYSELEGCQLDIQASNNLKNK